MRTKVTMLQLVQRLEPDNQVKAPLRQSRQAIENFPINEGARSSSVVVVGVASYDALFISSAF